jgi:hypothetical protein
MESGMHKHQEEVVLLQKKEKAKYKGSNKKVKNSYIQKTVQSYIN